MYTEKQKTYDKKYRKEHKEERKKASKKYYEKHKNEIKKYIEKHKEERKEYFKKYNQKYNKEHKEELKKYLIKRTTLFNTLKSNGCAICGYIKCIDALEFHHTNSKDKKFPIRAIKINSKDFIDEINKCILLCANCHREIHHKERRNIK